MSNKNKFRKTRKQKRITVAVIAFLVALATAATGVIIGLLPKNRKNKSNSDKEKVIQTDKVVPEDTIDQLDVLSLNELGVELDFPKAEETKGNNVYKNPTGDVDINKIVEDDNGTIWADEEALSKSDEVGNTKIDDQNSSLEIRENGDIYEKETGYEIIDENNNVIDSGNLDSNGVPDGYEYDTGRNEYVEEDELGKYIYSDTTFYFEDGEIAIKKGDLVSKETYEKAKKELYTTKPSISTETGKIEIKEPQIIVPETTIPETTTPETTTPETTPETNTDSYGGVVNANGTYTVYGTTYMDKATFEAFIMDSNSSVNFGYYNGVIYPISVINEMTNQDTLVK